MAADFSRIRHNPLLDWAGIELKQGAVLLDADANELVAVLDRRLRALASDVMGRSTVSQTTPEAFRITVGGGTLQIGPGRLYVDGLLAENHGGGAPVFDPLMAEPRRTGNTAFSAQPYVPVPPVLPISGRHLVYLDVWQRCVTHLEDPSLVESAVAVETSSRLQTVWQVRLLENVPSDTACGSELAAWNALTAPSSGRMSTGTFAVPPATDPCELPPGGGYRGLENQLYRVEIHTAGQPGAGATFKWSRENASVGARVASVISASELELDSLGRDEVLGLRDGDWVEVLDERRELAQRAGEMRRVSIPDPNTRRIIFATPLPATMLPANFPDSNFAAARQLRVLRWDQSGPIFRVGSNAPLQNLNDATASGVINMPAAGVQVQLEDGITVSFSSVAGPGFKVGDHWVFAARTSDASVEERVAAPPLGTHHHYARLGLWDVAAAAVTDCRTPWPPRHAGADCSCTECVTPESHTSGQLTIQAAVDRVRDSGGTVCLQPGLYALQEPVRIANARSLVIRGQGPATVVTAAGTAFQIEGSMAIAVEKLAVISLGRESAITARGVAGLRLSELALLVLGSSDFNGAGIGLQSLCAGVAIRDNFVVATDGIRSEAAPGQNAALVLTAALQVRDNVLWCRRQGVALEGAVAHLYGHRIEDNEVLGCRNGGLSALGFALPGASMRLCGNTLSVNGPGIACAVDGAWIEGNKLTGVRQGERQPSGSAIALAVGLDPTGSNQVQVLANQIRNFTEAGVHISAPVQDLVCKLNIIEDCGLGIFMNDGAEAGAVSIENNHLRGIRGLSGNLAAAGLVAGIAVTRTATATVAGNQVHRVGLQAGNARVLAGVLMLGVQRSRIHGNVVSQIGPIGDFGGIAAGIMVRAPYEQTHIAHNQVERDAEPQAAAGTAAWAALMVDDGNFQTLPGRIAGPPAAPAVPALPEAPGLPGVPGRPGAVAPTAPAGTEAAAAGPAPRKTTSRAAAKATVAASAVTAATASFGAIGANDAGASRLDGRPLQARALGDTVVRTASTSTLRLDDRRMLVMSGNRATLAVARNDFSNNAVQAVGGAAHVQGNNFAARGRVPAVSIEASSEALFSDNRCSHQGTRGSPAVQIASPVVLLNANRVRSGEVAISITGPEEVAALGNVTTGVVRLNNNPLTAPWGALNIRA